MKKRKHAGRPVSPAKPVANKTSPSGRESSPAAGTGENDRWLIAGICVFLAAITLAVFGQTVHHQFVNLDDGRYVYENPAVTNGLTLPGLTRAFTHGSPANWDPLTTVSHMLDCQLYGLNAGGHHLTNVLLHTMTVVLLFLALRTLTGRVWRCALVAAVFAIHPLRAESVAWVTERKDVLSGMFFMLTLWAYARYAQKRSSAGRPRPKTHAAVPAPGTGLWIFDYILVLFFFILGLMSKAMLVTVPFVLLLLDYWPLQRFKFQGPEFKVQSLVREKIPLFALSAVSCVAAIIAQGHAIQPLERLPLAMRAGNAVISCVVYLWQTVWPVKLAVFYPYSDSNLAAGKITLALVILAAITAAAFVWRRERPFLLVGWLWYGGMLVPVIGLLQFGEQAHADRYTYLPQIGLILALTWTAGRLGAGWRRREWWLGGMAAAVLATLGVCAFKQTACWHDSESLWTHTLDCTSNNAMAQHSVGILCFEKGQTDEAISHFQKAVDIQPDYTRVHVSLGLLLAQKGRLDEALAHLQKAVDLQPDDMETRIFYSDTLLQKGRVDEAIGQLQQALQTAVAKKADLLADQLRAQISRCQAALSSGDAGRTNVLIQNR